MLAQRQLFKKRRSEEFLELFFLSLSLTSRKEIKPVQLAMDLGCGIFFSSSTALQHIKHELML